MVALLEYYSMVLPPGKTIYSDYQQLRRLEQKVEKKLPEMINRKAAVHADASLTQVGKRQMSNAAERRGRLCLFVARSALSLALQALNGTPQSETQRCRPERKGLKLFNFIRQLNPQRMLTLRNTLLSGTSKFMGIQRFYYEHVTNHNAGFTVSAAKGLQNERRSCDAQNFSSLNYLRIMQCAGSTLPDPTFLSPACQFYTIATLS
ncbi:hypothetical protein EVAR_47767_1 [Eumeta japonica]|uniref:Uncharacterized protein n=1 Tax=Eumeta variegata TaxID=151549 RepID=A0A4C1XY67_EUMVA|nr:hypothetical protein EVAR_47767_1 [Eumeta japonica]